MPRVGGDLSPQSFIDEQDADFASSTPLTRRKWSPDRPGEPLSASDQRRLERTLTTSPAARRKARYDAAEQRAAARERALAKQDDPAEQARAAQAAIDGAAEAERLAAEDEARQKELWLADNADAHVDHAFKQKVWQERRNQALAAARASFTARGLRCGLYWVRHDPWDEGRLLTVARLEYDGEWPVWYFVGSEVPADIEDVPDSDIVAPLEPPT